MDKNIYSKTKPADILSAGFCILKRIKYFD